MSIDNFLESKVISIQSDKLALIATIANKSEHNFDEDLFVTLLYRVREEFHGNITVFEKQFKDTDTKNISVRLSNALKELNIDYKISDYEDLVEVHINGRVYKSFFLDKDFLKFSDLIICAKSFVHKHHSTTYPYSCIEELGLFLSTGKINWVKYKRSDILNILRAELRGIYEDYISSTSNSLRILGILDARNTKYTYEHIPFYWRRKNHGVIFDSDLDSISRILI